VLVLVMSSNKKPTARFDWRWVMSAEE